METKKILGIDLGTNSIGWALVEQNFEEKAGKIIGAGSRIIPMSQDQIGEFDKGNSVSQTKERTGYRSARRLRERHLLRRQRLHRVLNILKFLPEHYAKEIDFEKRLGQFLPEKEPKIAYRFNETSGKYEFIFTSSFNEMVDDFKINQPALLEGGKKIPYDWTIYYLRKKALRSRITKEELAWILLNFNQKRGYYQLRGEEEEEHSNKLVEFHSLKVVDVIPDEGVDKKGGKWYSLHLENGWIYRRSSKTDLSVWKGKVRDFIVTTDLNDDGSIKKDKEGVEKRSFRAPDENDWTLIKKKTEHAIDASSSTVGEYIYNNLLKNPNQKIKGKLVRTIERKYYKDELKAILSAQKQFHPELQDDDLYCACINELYPHNHAHQSVLEKRDIIHLFVDDIIFYQRPLKSKKSLISNCPLEYRKFSVDGEERINYLKVISKSHPLFQEFRLWQWLHNLKIYSRENDSDVTGQFIADIEDWENLFDFLNGRKEIDQKSLLKYFKLSEKKYRWNYVEDKNYPSNETRFQIQTRLAKVKDIPEDFLTSEIEQALWHIIYSVTDKTAYKKALETFARKHGLDRETFVESFEKFPPFKSDYGSFSEKAIKKLLPLMRLGKYWSWEAIDEKTKMRICKIITGEYDEEIKDRVRKMARDLKRESDFQGLQLWLAQYIVYGRHSEAALAGKWNSADDLRRYIDEFKQHSLRNPIVEQVVAETLRVVEDIWVKYGKGAKGFFDEIHIELGREMKHTAEERKKISDKVNENENTNLRIKALLVELLNDGQVENVRPYSPVQMELLKIYEDGALSSAHDIPDDIAKISKTAQPTRAELQRYKLWLEQRYRSPYTGEPIPLNKLFTPAYEIEHIIPQSRYFDDSFSNKVICEAAVNKLKDRQLSMEFIKNHHGEKVDTGFGCYVEILSEEAYKEFVNDNYAKNRAKRRKLLMEEIPEEMIERQINDTRYISKFISNLLSNIVRSDCNDDGVNSKNLLQCSGKITSILKQDWGLEAVWNELILPRFQRLNELTKSDSFTVWNPRLQKYLPTVPLELSRGFQKKRIDHRHHALDAIVIACATRDHINLLNNLYAHTPKVRYDLQRKLRKFEKASIRDKITGEMVEREIPKEFLKPWNTFTQDTRDVLEKIVVSFKQNIRVINKTTNKYEKYVEKKGTMVKELTPQTKGDSWAIRKSLHKETVAGKVNLERIKIPKGKILTATRKAIDSSFNLKAIESITDTGIQKILKNYLASKGGDPELAFSPEGLEEMNQNIELYNDGKRRQPIYKARIFEVGSKFPLGQTGNKKAKYVEAAKGSNLFFAIYQDEKGKRSFETIPLNVVIERQKQGLGPAPEINEKGDRLLFYLSPNDLVYVPTEEERENIKAIDFKNLNKEQLTRVYKFTDSSDTTGNFIPATVSNLLFNLSKKDQEKRGLNYYIQNEFGVGSPQSKNQKSIEGIMIKDVCIKLIVDRLGEIKYFIL